MLLGMRVSGSGFGLNVTVILITPPEVVGLRGGLLGQGLGPGW